MAATTAPKKRKAHVPPTPAPEETIPDALTPVRIQPKGDAPPPELITAFELDDVEYQIPKEPTPGQLMAYFNDVHRWGQAEALVRMVFNVLGQDAINALGASRDVGSEDVAAVFSFVQRWFLGHFQQATGK